MAKVNNAFQLVQSSIAQKRSNLQNLDAVLFPNNPEIHPKAYSLIEISGTNSSGKTNVLQYFMARTLLHDCNGKQCRIIFFNLKHKFKAENLIKQMENILKSSQQTEDPLTNEETKKISMHCLKAVDAFNLYSCEEFSFALDDIENVLMEDTNGEIVLLAIDGLDAFYWLDVVSHAKRMSTHYAQLIDRLRSICIKNNIYCVYTVDKKYIEAKGLNASLPNVNYKFVLEYNTEMCRTLNGKYFSITNDGVLF